MFKKILMPILISLIAIGCATSTPNLKNLPKDKVIIYDIVRDGCPACEYQKRVLKVKEVKEALDKYCILIKIPVNEQDKLPKEWMVTNITPTVHFVDSNFNRLIPSIHSVQPYQFLDAINQAYKKLTTKSTN